jgi:hypothetical protein
MVKTEEKQWANEGRSQRAPEANDVGGWQKENFRSAKTEMGRSQISEGRLKHRFVSAKIPPFDPGKAGCF